MKYRAQKLEQLTIDGTWEVTYLVIDETGKAVAKCWSWNDVHRIADALNAMVPSK